jgi:death on curing protein
MFGGPEGLRDDNMLESALARPMNQFHYDNQVDLAHLAAAYAFGIARNHPFVDGNKRAAFWRLVCFWAKMAIC